MNQIVIAMDMPSEKMIDLIDETTELPVIYGYKIGSLWITEKGIEVIDDCRERIENGKKIILDMQKWGTDIPEIITKQVGLVAPYVDELIVCPMGGGRQSLKAFAGACIKNKIAPICVLEMTHPEADSYLAPDAHFCILRDAIDFGIRRFVIPATKEPKKIIKDYIAVKVEELQVPLPVIFYATGFKVQGGQTKPMVDFGVSKFIVGRTVYEAEDPVAAIKELHKEING